MKMVVVGAAGQVGRLFAHRLAPLAAQLILLDVQGDESVRRLDVLTASTAVLRKVAAGASVLVNCLPDAVATAWAPRLADLLTPETLLVDTLSVKGPYLDALAPAGVTPPFECLSINPLFAPDLGFSGRPVLVVTVRDGALARQFRSYIAGWGAHLVAIARTEHDRAMAIMQAAVHAAVLAFGLALDRLPPALRDGRIGSPPFQTLLMLAARISGANPTVYWDIQHQNPFAAQGRQELAGALAELDRVVARGSAPDFSALLDRIDNALGQAGPDLRRRCAELFAVLTPSPTAPASEAQ